MPFPEAIGRMILLYIKRAVLVTVAAAAAYWLAAEYGLWPAMLAWAIAAAVACGTGAVLLRTSGIGRVTWRNRLAGYLIPWAWRLNRGRLWPLPVVSWVVWMAIGGGAVLLRPTASEGPSLVGVALFAAWVIDAAGLMYLLGTIGQATPGSRVGSLWKLVAVIAVLIGASVGLHLGGRTMAALVVGGGPPLAVGAGIGLVVLLLVTVGRNARWN